mmetsp:Transcript_63944/g.74906  ORF Transcript_63944/g.74906 Transcript_63944/m.74906 type:complete len:398 (+) Transcript_63944:137-1330(+)|eukprot:CAMPEP_0194372548 /NCGR_PEP_ID=MMETSP0174-20130528/20935_1 /TAXON_ID=216777 /ORGANISM="Proboscia alata, Strain PI-D3" /LENGTH=397 /DNA_ID=CAMNT_0039151151 /DNA_START=73 /DNA_END=1266 /DNA_ORIENTATION=-
MGKQRRRSKNKANAGNRPAGTTSSEENNEYHEPPGTSGRSHASRRQGFIGGFIQFGVTWLVIGFLIRVAKYSNKSFATNGDLKNATNIAPISVVASIALANETSDVTNISDETTPSIQVRESIERWSYEFSFGENNLGITEEIRGNFHPVVIFPLIKVKIDSKDAGADMNSKLKRYKWRKKVKMEKIPNYEVVGLKLNGEQKEAGEKSIVENGDTCKANNAKCSRYNVPYTVGIYNENRIVRDKEVLKKRYHSNNLSDESGFYMGIDIGAPVGTKVFSFADGKIHSVGASPDSMEYGRAVVVEYEIGLDKAKIWALYAHLDEKSIKGKRSGKRIKKGQLVGRIGNGLTNGRWPPHLYFQLSKSPLLIHSAHIAALDVDLQHTIDQHLDPRLVLGTIY